ncbi:MAG TPA: type II toxin-antitoxin system VapB family antitoxin [Alphaproteobacteria bacterium]
MGMNIKDEEAHRLAKELASLTGESLTRAVTEAIRERLARERRKGLVEKWLAIGEQLAPLWKEPYKSLDHGDLLYDEKGLPK